MLLESEETFIFNQNYCLVNLLCQVKVFSGNEIRLNLVLSLNLFQMWLSRKYCFCILQCFFILFLFSVNFGYKWPGRSVPRPAHSHRTGKRLSWAAGEDQKATTKLRGRLQTYQPVNFTTNTQVRLKRRLLFLKLMTSKVLVVFVVFNFAFEESIIRYFVYYLQQSCHILKL